MLTDFLDVSGHEFETLSEFFHYLDGEDLESLDGRLKIIGSISDYATREQFVESLDSHFTENQRAGNVLNVSAKVSETEERVPYYIYLDETFPIFFTTGTLTKEIPPTLQEFLLSRREMSRMWIAKRQMERMRSSLVEGNKHILIPFFTGRRTRNVNIPAKKRGETDRTVVYYGSDGLETFREMKHQYGILPANIEYEVPGHFKFRVKEEGIFTLLDSGVRQVYEVLQETKDHLRNVKGAIDTSSYGTEPNQLRQKEIPYSEPWAIQLEAGFKEEDVSNFQRNVELENHELTVTEFSPNYDPLGFSAELVDTENFARAELRTAKDSIRVYPRDGTDIDQNIRLFNFVDDYIDPHCTPVEV